MKKLLFPIIIVVVTVLSGCTKDDSVVTSSAKNYLTLWNPCEAVTVLQEYVEDVTNPSSKNFIKKEDRIVTFDMDGTFVGELYPTYFEYNMLEERVLDQGLCQKRQGASRAFRHEARPSCCQGLRRHDGGRV